MSRHRSSPLSPAAVLLGAAALGAAAYFLLSGSVRPRHPADSAPGRTARRSRFGDYAVVGRTVTVNRPRQELYAFWRDFSNLPAFMENVRAVEDTPHETTIWTIAAPAGQSVLVETEIVEDKRGELIAWRSVEGSDIETHGRVRFKDAPAGRGTEIEAIVAYVPPGGEIGLWIAKLFGREPEIQGRRELRRFKMLMETGEIATADNRRPDGGESAAATAAEEPRPGAGKGD